MRELTKEEYQVLYQIAKVGRNSVERLSVLFEKSDLLKYIDKLANMELIKIQYRDDMIHTLMETPEGSALIENPEYKSWLLDCSD